MSKRVRVCCLCYDYADEGALLVADPSGVGYVHSNGEERCPGQGDDDTDDRAEPMWLDIEDAAYFGIVAENAS